jgi:hypothetical protein
MRARLRTVLGAICFITGLCAANADDAKTPIVTVTGIGRLSCAHWLSNPEIEAQGNDWILGYWTASNEDGPINHMVGHNSDVDAILGEIKKICAQEPSTRLLEAVGRVYLQFQKSGK